MIELKFLLMTSAFCGLYTVSIMGQVETFIGLWEVEQVEIGDNNMTPVAKWTRINEDGSYESGNGWLQHAQGSWSYNDTSQTIVMKDSLGLLDEYGGFRVSYAHDQMQWSRQEECMQVEVTLKPISNLPMSPADYLVGLWEIDNPVKDDENKDSNSTLFNTQKVFIRWDRIYVSFDTNNKRQTGYWHIHGHKPEITLLPHDPELEPESWRIDVDSNKLRAISISEHNQDKSISYRRNNTF